MTRVEEIRRKAAGIAAGNDYDWDMFANGSIVRRLEEIAGAPEAGDAAALCECAGVLAAVDAMEAIRPFYAKHPKFLSEPEIVFGRLKRNASALLATAAAACLVRQRQWQELVLTLGEAAGFLHSGDLPPIAGPDPGDWTVTETLLDAACRQMGTAGYPAAAARFWTAWWLGAAEQRPCRRVPAALVVGGDGELADLVVETVEGADGAAGELIEHPLQALRLLDAALLTTLRQAWERSAAVPLTVVWRLDPRNPGLTSLPLAGPSLGGAAHVGFRLVAEKRLHDPACVVIAAVAADGRTLLPVGGQFAKLLTIQRAVVARQAAAGSPTLSALIAHLEQCGMQVHQCETVDDALDVASGLVTGLDKYYEDLKTRPDREDLVYLGGRKLSALNVPMDVLQIRYKPDDATEPDVVDDSRMKTRHGMRETVERRIPWSSVIEEMRRTPRCGVVLTGHGGHGKTQVWRMTLAGLAQEGLDMLTAATADLERLPLPIGLTCSKLAEAIVGMEERCDQEAALLESIAKTFASYGKAVPGYVRQRIELARDGNPEAQGPLWFVLDALDQVGTEGGLQKAIHAALSIVAGWENCRMIVTSRPEAYKERLTVFSRLEAFTQGQTHEDGFAAEHQLAALSTEQMDAFLRAWFVDSAAVEANRKWIDGNASAKEMAETPFLLTMMCGATALPGFRPDLTRGELYDLIVRSMLQTDRDGHRDATRDTPLVYLWSAAIHSVFGRFVKAGQIRHEDLFHALIGAPPTEALVRKKKKVKLKDLRSSKAAKHHIAELLDKRVLLEAGRDPVRYEFAHRTFAEFFAAWHLARNPNGALVRTEWEAAKTGFAETFARLKAGEPLPDLAPTRWEEPVIMAAAFAQDAAHYVEIIREHNPVIAARCVPEVRNGIDEELTKRVQRDLLSRMEDMRADVRVRIAAGEALGEIGDPRFELRRSETKVEYLMPPLIFIPGGDYTIGGDDSDSDDEKPAHSVKVASFWLGQFHVTNAEYGRFIAAGGYGNDMWWDEGAERPEEERPEYWEDRRYNRKSQPVVGVNWWEARAYCRWLTAMVWGEARREGFRLPAEVEYEAAARGGEGRTWAFGNRFDAARCNTDEGRVNRTTPVGIYGPQTPEGGYDLAGNADIWTSSLHKPYPYRAEDGREEAEDREAWRVLRGGSWVDLSGNARAAVRNGSWPRDRYDFAGFRLVCGVRPPS